MHPPAKGGDGKALAALLDRFQPATIEDADLIKAFFLTLFWGGPAGARPVFLFTAEPDDPQKGRGVGKSTVAKVGARLAGGHVDICPNEKMPDVMKRLLSPSGLECRVTLLDNVKSLKFSWGDYEALVTNDIISGHQMYEGEGRRPNTLVHCLTLNGASLSKDLAQRCVIVYLKRAKYTGPWEEETVALIDTRRWEIIGDILATLQGAPVKELGTHSRWGAWEDAVLSRVSMPEECQAVIAERQAAVDEDASESALVREYIAEKLRERDHNPAKAVVFIPSAIIAEWVNDATGEKRAKTKASGYLATLTIEELRKSDRGDSRGWVWCGKGAATQDAVALNKPRPAFNVTGL